MATIDALKRIQCINIFLLIAVIVSTHAVKYCYNASDVNSGNALLNQSCNTGEVHMLWTLVASDYQTVTPNQDERDFNYDYGDSSSRLAYDKASHCLIFRYVSTHFLATDLIKESVHVNFGCDLQDVCGSKEQNRILHDVIVNGTKGQLYCCSTDNCNKVDKLPHLPAENRICYHGTNNRSEAPTAELQSCPHPDVLCARQTTFLTSGKIESYFCDNDKLCQNQMSSGSFRSCTNTSVDNVTQEMCCCEPSICFKPAWTVASLHPDHRNSSTGVRQSPDKRTIMNPMAKQDDNLLVTGLVAALIFITVIGAGIIFITACKKRRQPRRDPNVIMQYERLSASDPDIEDAVVL